MSGRGYGDAEQAEGWKLLLDSTGYSTQKLGDDADAAGRTMEPTTVKSTLLLLVRSPR